jgi:pheromone shutdown-related protein TraB|tara:strand:+ start:516 stop:1658 length:1143 start_codon:yes stop_codon:yes gene_type:complete
LAVEKLEHNGKEVFLVGTAHVSKKSRDEVTDIIKTEKPDVVAIELCENRYHALKNKEAWQDTQIKDVIKQGQTYLFLSSLILSNIQRKIGKELGIDPGAEMLAAIETAEKSGAKLVFLDRDVQVTLKRAFNAMPLMEKLKVVKSLFFDTLTADVDEAFVENLKKEDVLADAMEELARTAPSVKRILVDERDVFMAGMLQRAEGKKIVAVVGAGHVEGIKRYIDKPITFSKLQTVPRKRKKLKIGGLVIPALLLGLLIYGFVTKGIGTTLNMLMWWFLINGTLSAVGAAAAFGHPLSMLTAFVAAPFTSVNPLLAAGWFAGYVEAKIRNPKVKDFKSLNKLDSFKAYWKNRVTRVLLVVAFANLGSIVGTFIALPVVVSLL